MAVGASGRPSSSGYDEGDDTLAGTRGGGRRGKVAPAVDPGDSLGRYTVQRRIGVGGMGVVYAAHDPELDRRVAIKVLRRHGRGAALLREAKALASLNHPNVVGVHDVGVHEGQVWLAMEFVEGQTLADWVADQKPGWQETLAVLVRAGEGLAAAHDEGLVHRDFKPANVMVANDGRVIVMDFGLAVFEAGHAASEVPEVAPDSTTNPQTQRLVGTPGYMAPEQMWQLPATTQSDQFAFCASAWEALFGERPFHGATLPALVESVTEGRRRPPPANTRVPRWLRVAFERGLEIEAPDRWRSMSALLRVLTEQPARRRRRFWAGCAAVTVTAAVAAVTAFTPTPRPCTGAKARLAGVWDDARRGAVREHLLALELPYGDALIDRVSDPMDAYALDWVRMHDDACEATHVRHEQTPDVLDLRMMCLARARETLLATADVLEQADDEVAERALEVVGALTPVQWCADVSALQARIAPPREEDRALVAEASQKLAESDAVRRAGRFEDALRLAKQVDDSPALRSYPPLEASVALSYGSALASLGRTEQAVTQLTRAHASALREGQDIEAATATAQLLALHANELDQAETARARSAEALALAKRSGDSRLQARVHLALSTALWREGDYPGAQREAEAALALLAAHVPPPLTELALARGTAASAVAAQGRHREALTLRESALADLLELYGPSHPSVAAANLGVGDSHLALGAYAQADTRFQRALEVQLSVYGEHHTKVARTRANIGLVRSRQGRQEEAETELRAALAIEIEAHGARHADVGTIRNNLSLVLRRQDRLAAAEAELREVLAIREETLDAGHPMLATTRANLGLMLRDQKKYAQAEAELRAAAESLRQTQGDDSVDFAQAMKMLGETLYAEGKYDDAVRALEVAWKRLGREAKSNVVAGTTAFSLAQALWESGSDHARARTLAKTARDSVAVEGKLYPETLQEIDDWLDAHPP